MKSKKKMMQILLVTGFVLMIAGLLVSIIVEELTQINLWVEGGGIATLLGFLLFGFAIAKS